MTTRAPAAGLAVFLCALGAAAASFTFTGGGATRSWNDSGNWSGGAVPPNDGNADVTIAGGSSVNLDGNRALHQLELTVSGTFTVSPGSVAGSYLLVSGGATSQIARGKLVMKVPLLAPSAMAEAGFEPQTALATSTTLELDGQASWPFGTSIANLLLVSGGNAVPDWGRLTLGPGSWLDLAGHPEVLGSLAGSGSVTNTSGTATALVVGLDGNDSTFSGVLGAKLSDQASVGSFDLVKLGAGTLTLSGASSIGGWVRVAEGTLVVNGSLTSGLNSMMPTSSSSGHGTVRGTGTV
ncbi:MAG: autotransporter-associated beta strand repeat-containing protein, partial [Myxococcales bacterium]